MGVIARTTWEFIMIIILPAYATLYLAFCLATAALVMLPGPLVTLIVTNALATGAGLAASQRS